MVGITGYKMLKNDYVLRVELLKTTRDDIWYAYTSNLKNRKMYIDNIDKFSLKFPEWGTLIRKAESDRYMVKDGNGWI
jgi:hypothetical protein